MKTVKELRDELDKLIADGKGDRRIKIKKMGQFSNYSTKDIDEVIDHKSYVTDACHENVMLITSY